MKISTVQFSPAQLQGIFSALPAAQHIVTLLGNLKLVLLEKCISITTSYPSTNHIRIEQVHILAVY